MGFLGGVNSSVLGDAFFTEMEFVISRCPFDLSKIFWNDSVSGTTCELRKFPSRRQLSSMEIQQIWQEINREDVMLGVPRRSVTGNWTKEKLPKFKIIIRPWISSHWHMVVVFLRIFFWGGVFTHVFHPFQLSSNIFHFEAQLKNGIPTVAGLNDANFYFRYPPVN